MEEALEHHCPVEFFEDAFFRIQLQTEVIVEIALFDPVPEPLAALIAFNITELEANVAAVDALQLGNDLAQRGILESNCPAGLEA